MSAQQQTKDNQQFFKGQKWKDSNFNDFCKIINEISIRIYAVKKNRRMFFTRIVI